MWCGYYAHWISCYTKWKSENIFLPVFFLALWAEIFAPQSVLAGDCSGCLHIFLQASWLLTHESFTFFWISSKALFIQFFGHCNRGIVLLGTLASTVAFRLARLSWVNGSLSRVVDTKNTVLLLLGGDVMCAVRTQEHTKIDKNKPVVAFREKGNA